MSNEWILESYRQLRLATLCRRCRTLLEQFPPAVARGLPQELDSEVCTPLLRSEWIPGIGKAAERATPGQEGPEPGDALPHRSAFPRTVFHHFRIRWDSLCSRRADDGPNDREFMADVLSASLKKAAEGKAAPKATAVDEETYHQELLEWANALPPCEYPEWRSTVACWVHESAALRGWRRIERRIVPLLKEHAAAYDWQQLAEDCRNVQKQAENRRRWATFFPRDPWERRFLGDVRDLAQECQSAFRHLEDEHAKGYGPVAEIQHLVDEIDKFVEQSYREEPGPIAWLEALPDSSRVPEEPFWAGLESAIETLDNAPLLERFCRGNPVNFRETAARIALITCSVAALCGIDGEAPAWDAVQESAEQLLANTRVSVEWIRERSAGGAEDTALSQGGIEDVYEPEIEESEFRRMGVIAIGEQTSVCVLPAVRVVPVPGRHVVDALAQRVPFFAKGQKWRDTYEWFVQRLLDVRRPIKADQKLRHVATNLLNSFRPGAARELRKAEELRTKREANDSITETVDQYRRLTISLYDFLTRLGVRLQPELDPVTLCGRIREPLPTECDVRWKRSGAALGTVLEFPGFDDPYKPGAWVISCPMDTSDAALKCLNLPRPPSLAPAGQETPICPTPIIRWHNELQRRALGEVLPENDVSQAPTEIDAWLWDDENGRLWFDQVVRGAVGGTGPNDTTPWFETLRDWLGCYPGPDLAAGVCRWPAEAEKRLPNLCWVCDEKADACEVIGEVRRYAVRPELAECTLSLGSSRKYQGLEYACHLQETARDFFPEESHLLELVDHLFHESCAEPWEGKKPDPSPVAGPLLGEIVRLAGGSEPPDGPVGLREIPPERARGLDILLEQLVGWCEEYGLRITPTCWHFHEPVFQDSLSEHELAVSEKRFAQAKEGQVLLGRFGLDLKDDPASVSCVVSISAGPVPKGYCEMKETLESQPGKAAEELGRALASWPEEWLKGDEAKESAAARVFVDCWDAQAGWPEAHPEVASTFRKHFEAAAVSALKMRVKVPTDREFSEANWVEIAKEPDRGGRKIRRVLRPALMCQNGKFIVPAQVELE